MHPKTVVVPLDGSPPAERALDAGLALARAFAADLHLVRATWHRPPDLEVRYLEERAEELAFSATRCSVVHGFAADAVRRFLADVDEPLLCLATRGHSGFGELLLGSVATELLAESPCPAVLVGPAYDPPTAPDLVGPILFAFDASPAARALTPTVLDWSDQLGLDVRVVTVVHHDGASNGDRRNRAVRLAAEDVVQLLDRRGATGEAVEIECIEPARAILRDAQGCPPALIAAGTTRSARSRGAAQASRAVFGTTAERVVRHATVPVLVAEP